MLTRRRPAKTDIEPKAHATWLARLLLFLVVALGITATAVVAFLRVDHQELLRRVILLHLRYELKRDVSLQQVSVDYRRGRVLVRDLVIRDATQRRYPLAAAKRIVITYNPRAFRAAPLRPMSAISQVAVESPRLYVARNAKGTWNFNDLLQRERKPSKDQFRGAVLVKNGEIVYHDAQGFHGSGPLDERLTMLNGRVTLAGDGYLPFRLSAVSTGGRVRDLLITGGVEPAKQRVHGEARLTDINLATLRQYLPTRMVTLTSGRVGGRLELDVAPGPDKKMRVAVTALADLQQVVGTVRLRDKVLPCTVVSGQVRFADDALQLIDVHAAVDGLPAVVDGGISHFASPIAALQVTFQQIDTARVGRLVPGFDKLHIACAGPATGWAQLIGPLSAFQVIGHLAGPTVSSPYGTYAALEGDVRYGGGKLELSNLIAQGFRGSVSGRAWLDLDPEAETLLLADGMAYDVELNAVTRQFITETPAPGDQAPAVSLRDLRGAVTGPIALTVRRDGRVRLAGHAVSPAVSLGDLAHGAVDASLRMDIMQHKVQVSIRNLTAHTPEGTFQVQGSIAEDNSVQFLVRGSEVKLAELAKRAGRENVGGLGYLSGQITGPLSAPSFYGMVQAQDVTVEKWTLAHLSTNVAASLAPTPEVKLENLRLYAGESELRGALTLSASALTSQDWRVAGKVSLPRTALASLQKIYGQEFPLDGFVDGEVAFTDVPSQPGATGRITLRRPVLRLAQMPLQFDSASADFTLRGKTVEIPNAVFFYQGAPLTATGSLSFDPHTVGPQLDLQVKAPSVNLDALTMLVRADSPEAGLLGTDVRLRLPLDVSGVLALEAGITGTLTDSKGAFSAPDFAKSLRIHGKVDGGDHGLAVAGVPFTKFSAAGEYQGEAQEFTLNAFTLQRLDSGQDYQVALREPGVFTLPDTLAGLKLTLQGATPDADGKPQGASLDQLRRDLFAIASRVEADYRALRDTFPLENMAVGAVDPAMATPTFLTPVVQALQNIPDPFSGRGTIEMELAGTWAKAPAPSQFTIVTEVKLQDLVVAGHDMPVIAGKLTYDTAPRTLTIDNLLAEGTGRLAGETPAEKLTAELDGTVTLPVLDATGREIIPGPINLTFEAQNVDPQMVGDWLPQLPWLRQLKGKATITALADATLAHPHLEASVDVINPAVKVGEQEVGFGMLTTVVTLDDNKLTIGGDGPFLQFKDKDNVSKPLELAGYLPFRWKGLLQPEIPLDKAMAFTIRLPKQGLEVVRAYLPELPKGEGHIEGVLQISGTPAQWKFDQGRLLAQAPVLELPVDDQDLPDRLTQVTVDLGVRSEPVNGHRVNVLEVNDISALYDRANYTPPKQDPKIIATIKSLFGVKPKVATPLTGAVVAQGSVRLSLPEDKALSISDATRRLEYDLYAKTVRAPLRWRDLFQGNVTSYLHLGNNPETRAPLLAGVVYAENARLTYTGEAGGAFVPPKLPFNPELSLALQIGRGNSFQFGQDSALLNNTLSLNIPFTPTELSRVELYSPISATDQSWAQYWKSAKPPVEREHPAYAYSAETFQAAPYSGSRGWVTGELLDPKVQLSYTVQPNKAQVRLPRGVLTVRNGTGELRVEHFTPTRFNVDATATSTVKGYRIAADINGDLLDFKELPKHIRFSTLSAPRGMPSELSQDETYAYLIGMSDLEAVVRGKQQPWTPISSFGETIGNNLLNDLARRMGVMDLFNLDNIALERTEDQQRVSITTEEIPFSRWGSVRLGASQELFTEPREWQAWLEYRIPEYKLLRDLSVNGEVNGKPGTKSEVNLNLKYQFRF